MGVSEVRKGAERKSPNFSSFCPEFCAEKCSIENTAIARKIKKKPETLTKMGKEKVNKVPQAQGGNFGVQKGGPNGPFSATKS